MNHFCASISVWEVRFTFATHNCIDCKGPMAVEIICICYDHARNNLFMLYTIWKTTTRWIKCKIPHLMKLYSLFMGRIGRPGGWKYFWSQPTHDAFCHKKHFRTIRIFYMLLATLWALCIKNILELAELKSVEICDRTQNLYFCDDRSFHNNKKVNNQ